MSPTALLRARRSAADVVSRCGGRAARRSLAREKGDQRIAWTRQSARTARVHAVLADHADPAGRTGLWRNYEAELERRLLPVPPFAVLREPAVMETMLVRGRLLRQRELAFLAASTAEHRRRRLLEEDLAGDPPLFAAELVTSPTALHHACHLERYRHATGVDPCALGTVVEWGGGYGGFARTLRRGAGARPPAHVIVDLPVVGALQWTYLTTIFGEDAVDVAAGPGHRPRAGAITVVPPALAGTLDVAADLFVSLWALSETARARQDEVRTTGWFGASRLLLGFQASSARLPDAGHVGHLLEDAGAMLRPVPARPRNLYGFL